MKFKRKQLSGLSIISLLTFILLVTGLSQLAFASSETWWNTDWAYRIKLTFDNSASSENLVNFPIMINLSRAGSDFWSHVDSDYEDLRFIDDDATTELYFEIEYWNCGDKEAYAWVKVPQIDVGSTTDFIYVYYGNSGASESSYHSPTDVWDSNFMMVHHLEETTGSHHDSTSNDNDSTVVSVTTQGSAAGKIGGADEFVLASSDYITIGDSNSINLTTYTLELWFNADTPSVATQALLGRGEDWTNDKAQWIIEIDDAKNPDKVQLWYEEANDDDHEFASATSISSGTWYYVAISRDHSGERVVVYLQGSSENDVADAFTPWSGPTPVEIGCRRNKGTPNVRQDYFDGIIDEVRVSDTPRSADWIAASYLSMNDEFIAFSPEEEEGELTLTVTNPQNITYYTKTAVVTLEGTANLDADITYSLDGQDNVTVGGSTQSFSTSLTSLSYSTHSITVYAAETANASNTASATIDFTVEKPPCAGCNYRMKLTFDNSFSSEAHSSFPVLVVLNPSRIDYGKTSATDIRFCDGDTLLPKETELWDEAGNSYIWVKVPQIDNSDTDYIYAYYNCSSTNNDDANSVWDSYAMVHHLEETSGTVTDSTSNGNDGTYSGATQDAPGKIDGANRFNATSRAPQPDNLGDYIAVPHHDSLNLGTGDFTISAWVRFNASTASADADILRKGNTNTGPKNYKLELLDNKIQGVLYEAGGDSSTVTTSETYSDDNWHFLVLRREAATLYLYVNGTQKASAGSADQDVSNTAAMSIGSKDDYADDFFDGIIDEVRIIKTARSPDWIEASYLSMNDEFITYGSEENAPASSIESCNSEGAEKNTFNPSDTIFVNGSGYEASTSYPFHVVDDVETWGDGMTIPTRVSGTETSVSANTDGDIPATTVWSSALPGEYDIVVDFNSNGYYDAGVDALDDLDVSGAGFFVIPEYVVGTVLALAMCFAGFGLYWRSRSSKRRVL